MRNVNSSRTISFLFSCVLLLVSLPVLAAPSTLSVIPYDQITYKAKSDIRIDSGDLWIDAIKGTDLWTSADGKDNNHELPRLLFEPKGDFIFSAKVTPDFNSAYDGGALILFGDGLHWAKLLFEQFKSGDTGVASTVSRGFGDDVYHGVVTAKSHYLKIVRRDKLIVFYRSDDGKSWHMLRNFGFGPGTGSGFEGPISIGFSAQSPISEHHDVHFSDIRFEEKTFKDFWQGE
ncbi:MAG: regulation of enolase protein 1 (concanavalin A-like superfamily) [Flavobacteriales bacterium]|jgi:regulation of enolase protein 1 (concanavalin A-like superfamily)